MNKMSLLRSLVYGNKAVVICVAFTIATMVDLLICVTQGVMDIPYWHLGYRFVLCVLAVLSFYLFKFFNKLPLYAMLIIHFGIGLTIMLSSVWLTSLFSEVHPNAYRDAARTVAIVYPIIIIGCIIIDGIRTAKVNKILKKLR